MQNANLEFRKIPSLQFLYEVNENGTVFRNVKSKKQNLIKLDFHHSKAGYYVTFVKLKGRSTRVMIHKVVAECWLGPKPEGLEIDHIDRNSHNNDYRNLRYVTHSEQMRNRELSQRIIDQATRNVQAYVKTIMVPCAVNGQWFESTSAAARYISEQVGVDAEKVRYRLKNRRSSIYGFSITYGNAETRRTHPTGVRNSPMYLVGTLSRFNDAKKQEVEQRVKHAHV